MNLTFILTVLFSPNEPVHSLGFFTSVHADPDPGGISLCGSVWIRIRNTGTSIVGHRYF